MKFKAFTAVLLAALCTFSPVAYMADVSVKLNGKTLECDAQPFIEEDRTLVPMRAIFEAVGASVEWDDSTKTVIASRVKNGEPVFVAIQADSRKAFINSEEQHLDVPAKIVSDRTFVPLRFAVEALGEKVEWDAGTYTVNITTK
jgi:hypothetical protein